MGISRNRNRPIIGREAFPSGGHSKRIGNSSYMTCQNCGMPNDTKTLTLKDDHDGEGGLVQKSGASPAEKENRSGCRFCGSWNSIQGHPAPLVPDETLKNPGRR